jgi:hypothetical protein
MPIFSVETAIFSVGVADFFLNLIWSTGKLCILTFTVYRSEIKLIVIKCEIN